MIAPFKQFAVWINQCHKCLFILAVILATIFCIGISNADAAGLLNDEETGFIGWDVGSSMETSITTEGFTLITGRAIFKANGEGNPKFMQWMPSKVKVEYKQLGNLQGEILGDSTFLVSRQVYIYEVGAEGRGTPSNYAIALCQFENPYQELAGGFVYCLENISPALKDTVIEGYVAEAQKYWVGFEGKYPLIGDNYQLHCRGLLRLDADFKKSLGEYECVVYHPMNPANTSALVMGVENCRDKTFFKVGMVINLL